MQLCELLNLTKSKGVERFPLNLNIVCQNSVNMDTELFPVYAREIPEC